MSIGGRREHERHLRVGEQAAEHDNPHQVRHPKRNSAQPLALRCG